MKPGRYSDSIGYQQWVMSLIGEGDNLFAVIDPSRYEDQEECLKALGLSAEDFEALPNLYEKYAVSIRDRGPRIFSASMESTQWQGIFAQAYQQQAASFLVASSLVAVHAHLKSLVRLQMPDGGNSLFRFQDVIVLSALAPVLDDRQRWAMLGPARHWVTVDVCGYPHVIGRPERLIRPEKLELTAYQLKVLDDALAPFTVIYQANETDGALLQGLDQCARVRLVRARMQRARRHGLRRDEDIALYCVLSLQLPRGFDRVGPVADAIRDAQRNGTGFGEEIDRVPVQRWREWDEQLDISYI